MKRFMIFTVVLTVLAVPSLLLAADAVAPAKAVTGANNTVTIPIEIANQDGLMAIDIPLKFSEGVTLKSVDFADTRVAHFDLQIAKIDNETNTVIIGLISQIQPEKRENLAAGEGVIANLVFEIDDPSISSIDLEATIIEKPHHSMTFIYANEIGQRDGVSQNRTAPEFSSVSLSLGDASLPVSFGLEQNYPNPFNPTTNMAFSLPVASSVRLTVFNLLGQEVQTIIDAPFEAGQHTVTWDGQNEAGQQVSSGIYFYRLEAGEYVATKKMMMLK